MEGKARFIFPVVITAIIVFVTSGALTLFDTGWRNDFVIRWCSAFAIGWSLAATNPHLPGPPPRQLPLSRDPPRPQPPPAHRRRHRTVRPGGLTRWQAAAHGRHERSTSHETIRICRLERRPAPRQGLGLDREPRAGNLSLHVLQPLWREAGHQSGGTAWGVSRRLFYHVVRQTTRHGELRAGAGRQQIGSRHRQGRRWLFHNLSISPSPRRYR